MARTTHPFLPLHPYHSLSSAAYHPRAPERGVPLSLRDVNRVLPARHRAHTHALPRIWPSLSPSAPAPSCSPTLLVLRLISIILPEMCRIRTRTECNAVSAERAPSCVHPAGSLAFLAVRVRPRVLSSAPDSPRAFNASHTFAVQSTYLAWSVCGTFIFRVCIRRGLI